MAYQIRKAQERGHADHGWLKTFHTFSFADYLDPQWMGFKTLRVMNEDRIAGGQGFGQHGHQDMEIVTYVIEGALRHTDSMGNSEVLSAGEVQRMSAGTGVMHSEVNASEKEECHLYQIWILPEKAGSAPSYEQKPFWGRLEQEHRVLIASRDGRNESLKIHQDAEIWLQRLKLGESTTVAVPNEKGLWLQVIAGEARIGEETLKAGDGFAASSGNLDLQAATDLEIMEFIL